ncbi:MAG: FHA domain-containing protein [Myxococcota bacterium]|nr:FHA domain-containing protein [Myxococcota bacterium]
MIKCPECGTSNEAYFRFCRQCGARVKDRDGNAEPDTELNEVPSEEDRLGHALTEAALMEDEIPDTTPHVTLSPKDGPPVDFPQLDEPAEQPELEVSTTSSSRTSCSECDRPLLPEASFCAACGAPVRPPTAIRKLERSGKTRGRLVLLRDDGSPGPTYELEDGTTILGRNGGHLSFPDDPFLADEHAELTYVGNDLSVRPLDSTNGVYIRIVGEVRIRSGDTFRIGQELLRFDSRSKLSASGSEGEAVTLLSSRPSIDVWGRLAQLVGANTFANNFLLEDDDVFLGRDRGHIRFPDDGYVSGSHAVLARRAGKVYLKDLGSSNGTYVRIYEKRALISGDTILLGQQLFRVEPP